MDDYATEIARKNAKNAIKPYMVTFKKCLKKMRLSNLVIMLLS